MSWEFVLDIRKQITLDKAIELCSLTGYEFFVFMGWVHYKNGDRLEIKREEVK